MQYVTFQQKEDVESQILTLKNRLSASSSDIGDWKIIKIYEARMSGKSDPYDFEELVNARQNIRDQINELEVIYDNMNINSDELNN